MQQSLQAWLKERSGDGSERAVFLGTEQDACFAFAPATCIGFFRAHVAHRRIMR
jgi:hypothetical protein